MEGALAEHPGDVRGRTLRHLLVAADLIGLVIAFGLIAVTGIVARPLAQAPELLACLPVWALIAGVLGMYQLPERRLDHSVADELGRTLLVSTAWIWVFSLTAAVARQTPVPTAGLVAIWLLSACMVLVSRGLARHLVTGRAWYRQRVLVLGAAADADRVVRRLERHPEYGLEVIGVAKLDPMPRGPAPRFDPLLAAARGEPGDLGHAPATSADGLLGRIRRLVDEVGAHRVVMATAPTDLEERSVLVRGLIGDRIAVDLVSAQPDGWSSTTALHHMEGLPMITVSPVRPSRIAHLGKRALDIALSALALGVLSPLLAYCAVRIRFDSPGPVFFRQRRIGREGESFEMLKFRTMVADADDRKRDVDLLNMHAAGERGQMFKIPSDPRITRFGARLRRWSLDELPQLFNVFRGDMSMVGPRPLIPVEAKLVNDHYAERARMRPGITGPWQVHGRSDIGFDDMVRLDYSYAMHWSLAGDVRLLIRTAGAVVAGRGAY